MSVTVHIPNPLRPYVGGKDAVEMAPAMVSDLLKELVAEHPQLRAHLFGDDGQLRTFVNVYLNDRHVRDLPRQAMWATDGDEVSIVPSIAGGTVEDVADQIQLTQAEILRYSRHLVLPEVGARGQRRIKAARVLVVGAGGLGSPAALYLAAAGVGTIGLVDFDEVQATNLHRQILYGTGVIGQPKLESARVRLQDLNPHVQVLTFPLRLSSENAIEVLKEFDIVLDGTDNYSTRYLVNDACVILGKPYVYGAIFRFDGQVSVFHALAGPCYRCLYPEPPPLGLIPSCAEGGVLGVLPGIIGALQGLEVLKLILGVGDTLVGRLVLFDALKFRFRELRVRKNADCVLCGPNPIVRELVEYEAFCGTDQTAAYEGPEITALDLALILKETSDLVLMDVREVSEWDICHIPGAQLIPLSQLPTRLSELDRHKEIVTVCHRGTRSMRAVEILKAAGFSKVKSLRGGIEAWATEVDQSVPRY